MGWYQRLNKIDAHVPCPTLPRESSALANTCTFQDRAGSRDRKEAILAPRSSYYKINPDLLGEPGESWAEEIFQFMETPQREHVCIASFVRHCHL